MFYDTLLSRVKKCCRLLKDNFQPKYPQYSENVTAGRKNVNKKKSDRANFFGQTDLNKFSLILILYESFNF